MSNEWYTPAKYIEAARQVMGSIDLDPASCELANQTVRAARYYTQEDNGLAQEWFGNVWLNPPYGKRQAATNEGRSILNSFIFKAIREYEYGRVNQVVMLVPGLISTSWLNALMDMNTALCFASKRVRFPGPVPNPTTRDGKSAHMFGTIFAYLGANEQAFVEQFSKFGRIAKAIDTPVARPRQLELVS